MNKVICVAFIIATIIVIASSCASTRKVVYFDNIKDTNLKSEYANIEPVIQINDILSIIISSQSAEASAPFNAPNESTFITSSASSSTNRLTIGYLVNLKGEIQFPILGLKLSSPPDAARPSAAAGTRSRRRRARSTRGRS